MAHGLHSPHGQPGLEGLAVELAGSRVVVVGFARTGQAVARVLVPLGTEVVVVEDRPSSDAVSLASSLGARLVGSPSDGQLAGLLEEARLVVVSPGVPPRHRVFSLARPGQLMSEIELAGRIATVPIVGVTGTNGKTTVTALVTDMLCASGRSCVAAGNIGRPLLDAVTEAGLEVVVAEVSSFQLAFTERFHASVACWLNLAEDHLDWHGTLAAYVAAKAKVLANQVPTDVVVANAMDPVVMDQVRHSKARLVTFGGDRGDYRLVDDHLVGPDGPIFGVSAMARQMPHDLANALAAVAVAVEAGATLEGCRAALGAWMPAEHRIALVDVVGGVGYYDDSKATTPSAVAAALAGFDSVVLIAGGRNKGLDLSVLVDAAERDGHQVVRGVVAIGEAAGEVAAAFGGGPYHLRLAASMDEAVRHAQALAKAGDVVLLSPGCASFDWYRSYGDRGDDFIRAVRTLHGRPEDARFQGDHR